jgi:hypothetical protein
MSIPQTTVFHVDKGEGWLMDAYMTVVLVTRDIDVGDCLRYCRLQSVVVR